MWILHSFLIRLEVSWRFSFQTKNHADETEKPEESEDAVEAQGTGRGGSEFDTWGSGSAASFWSCFS